MSVSDSATLPIPEPSPDSTSPSWDGPAATSNSGRMSGTPEPTTKGLGRWRTDLMVVALYVAMAALVTGRLWRDPTGRASGVNASDPTLFEWMLAHAARSVTHLENPLLSTRMSTPSGLNIMANTSILGLGIALTPITVVWGPSVSYLIVITFGLAATAAAWYFVLSRHVTRSRLAAFVGAAFCAFCPGMLSQAGGHPHISVQFLVPLIIWGVFRLRETIRPVRDGLVLGGLIAAQVFIGEEILFITAMVCAVCVAGYCMFRGADARRSWRPFLTGLGVAALLAILLVAYPLFVQHFGPQHYRHVPQIDQYGADLLAYGAYSPLTIGGDPTAEIHLARNHTELNAFFGYPLLVLIVAVMWWQRRRLAVRLAAIVAVVFGLLSLGHDILIHGKYTGIPGPWRLFVRQPLFESVVTTRFALVVAAAIGVTLSVAIEQVLRINKRRTLALACVRSVPRRHARAADTPAITRYDSNAGARCPGWRRLAAVRHRRRGGHASPTDAGGHRRPHELVRQRRAGLPGDARILPWTEAGFGRLGYFQHSDDSDGSAPDPGRPHRGARSSHRCDPATCSGRPGVSRDRSHGHVNPSAQCRRN